MENGDSLLNKGVKAQADNPIKGDWMDNTKLNLSLDDIKTMSKEVFKEKVSAPKGRISVPLLRKIKFVQSYVFTA